MRYDVIGEDARLPVQNIRELLFHSLCVFPLRARDDRINWTLDEDDTCGLRDLDTLGRA